MRYSVLVETRLRPGIADPQGATIERSLPALGFEGIRGVRVGKAIRFELEATDEAEAQAHADG
jgi:phosphoribosylformylglycinamidine synthase PurS subunit